MNPGNLNYEEKLLYSALLFCEIRSPKGIDEKLLNIEKYLAIGIDVNTQDANDFNNTPLHIAAKKGELEIVDFLLKKGANPKLTNVQNQTPSDIANLTQITNKKNIIKNINASVSSIKLKSNNEVKMSTKIEHHSKMHEKKALRNESRPGASGIDGQLYEINLIGLLLHRALNDQDIDEFYIGSNLKGLGAFDDIVFKYHLKNKANPNIVFIQSKHRGDPNKYKLTNNTLLNSNTDFSLDKYFNSYMTIQDIMKRSNINVMYDNDVPTSDRRFIIYTPLMENLDKKKRSQVNGKENLIQTNNSKNGFLYDYDATDVEVILAKFLAKTFAANIKEDKFKNMLRNEIIAEYHVFFAHNIIFISEKCSEAYVASFDEKFIESKNKILMIIRETLIKEMKLEEQNSMSSMKFKLPKYFGNVDVPLIDEEYIELWKIMRDIIEKSKTTVVGKSIKRIVIKNKVTDKIITKDYLKKVKNLVGDILILDNETGLYKLNLNASSNNSKIFVERLISNIKIESDLKEFRFHIELDKFPQLSLRNEGNLKKHLTGFLDKLQLYTNQANEEEVERILINEINDLYNNENRNIDNLYHIQTRAIYQMYHGIVQNWWKDTEKHYLTKCCEFYKQAKEIVLSFKSLMYIYNYIYVTKIDNLKVCFDEGAIKDLRKQALMKLADANALNIITKDVILTSSKLKQCFNDKKYVFIDLEDIKMSSDIEIILSEVSRTTVDAIIFIVNDQKYFSFLKPKIIDILYKNKVIFVSHSTIIINKCNVGIYRDEKNTLKNLETNIKKKIVNESHVVLQGSKIPFASLITENMYDLVEDNVLHNLIKDKVFEIGKEFTIKTTEFYESNFIPQDDFAAMITYNMYDLNFSQLMRVFFKTNSIHVRKELIIKTTEFYVGRRVCRCLVLKLPEDQYGIEFNLINDKNIAFNKNKKDILIISNDILVFDENCKKHCDKNIHWFKNENNNVKWIKSQGSIKKIMKWVEKVECDGNELCATEVQSLNQLADRVVIISAGAGMGKSTLCGHLITQTKSTNKCIECVLKINLLDLTNELNVRQEHNIEMTLGWFMSILFKEFSMRETDFFNSMNKWKDLFDDIKFLDVDNRIYLNSKKVPELHQQTLFEFKIFLNLYNDSKISLLLDGFDEICPDYKNGAIKLLNLLKNSRMKCIWITTRPMIINELERAINSFSYTLKGFSKSEQITFMEKFWGLNFFSNDYDNNDFQNVRKEYIARVLDNLSHQIMDTYNQFTSTPLHLRMITEAFRENFEHFILNSTPIYHNAHSTLNLIKLYEKFINKKFYEIRFAEKKDSTLFTDPDMMMIRAREQILFIENHKKLAAYSLLHKKSKNKQMQNDIVAAGILKEDDFKHTRDLIKRFNSGDEKTGIIDSIKDNKPRFVHLTYAEYFSCELICDKLQQKGNLNNESLSNFLVDHVLLSEETEGIRRFFDSKLECDQLFSKVTSKSISAALLNQKFYNNSALNIAVVEGRQNIALFLLNNIDQFLNNNNMDDFIALLVNKRSLCCTLCGTHKYRGLGALSQMIEMIKQVDCKKLEKLFFCEDYPNSNIFMICINDFENFTSKFRLKVDSIVKLTSPEVLVKVLLTPKIIINSYKRPLLHTMAEVKQNVYFLNTVLQNLNRDQCMRVFCVKDKMRRIPAHFAAYCDNIEFFDLMINFVDMKQMKIINSYKDENGKIPLRCFGSKMFSSLGRFKILCAMAGFRFVYKDEGEWLLYDMDNPDCIW